MSRVRYKLKFGFANISSKSLIKKQWKYYVKRKNSCPECSKRSAYRKDIILGISSSFQTGYITAST